MAQEQRSPRQDGHAVILRGADEQLAALERVWAAGTTSDLRTDEAAWQTLRRALNVSRRAEGARLLFEND